ncbi:hypothetical protein [Paraburkholderia youngii]|uniref:ATP-dependent DNA ligase n=1 Tax=Paraburkholderia youngii TaxID=2782701 RepID=UPI003D20F234
MDASDLMLATLYRRPFSDPGRIYEIKYDGFRCMVRKTGESVDLMSRNGNLMNDSFPEIVAAVAAIPRDFVWDAKLTVDDATGRSSFERLQRRAVTRTRMNVRAAAEADPARLCLIDALSFDGADIRGLPLTERKERLRDAFDDTATRAATAPPNPEKTISLCWMGSRRSTQSGVLAETCWYVIAAQTLGPYTSTYER